MESDTTVSVVSALIAVVAAAVAVWQALLTRRQTKSAELEADATERAAATSALAHALELQRDRSEDDLLSRSQAGRISAWWGALPDNGWGVYLRNGSEAPVFHVYATVTGSDDGSDAGQAYLPVLPPGPAPAFQVLPPDGAALPRSARPVRVTFTDEAGQRWERDRHGKLRRFEATLVVVATDLPRRTALEQFAEEFSASYGVTLEYEIIHTSILDELRPLFVTPAGDTVDALIGAHDWIGSLAHQGLIQPILLSGDQRKAFQSWALNSLRSGGKLYGVPTTLDTAALIRNVDLAPQAPATMEDLIATGNNLRDQGQVIETLAVRVSNEGDPFQLWPLFTSAGGSLFARVEGEWDPRRVELDTPASIGAFDRLRSLGEQGGHILRRSMDRSEAFDLFASGKSAYLISTSDGLERARRDGLHVAVSAVPPFGGGSPARGMCLVHGLFFPKGGRNQLLAHNLFSDYLTHRTVMTALSETVVSPVALGDGSWQDQDIVEYQRICETSDPMPSFPGMRRVWEIVGRAQADAIRGAQAEGVARQAAKEVHLALISAGVVDAET